VEPVLFRIEAHEQFGQHRYDANRHFFAGVNSIQREFSDSFEHEPTTSTSTIWLRLRRVVVNAG
jgi:hypothetical protein